MVIIEILEESENKGHRENWNKKRLSRMGIKGGFFVCFCFFNFILFYFFRFGQDGKKFRKNENDGFFYS